MLSDWYPDDNRVTADIARGFTGCRCVKGNTTIITPLQMLVLLAFEGFRESLRFSVIVGTNLMTDH